MSPSFGEWRSRVGAREAEYLVSCADQFLDDNGAEMY
jgi:hypothetical protein